MENHKTEEQVIDSNLINEIISLNEQLDNVWQYHPDNKNRINVVEEYNKIKLAIEQLEEEYKMNHTK